MVCPYCQLYTQIKNSRPRKSGLSVWRRRFCPNCRILFTTTETIVVESILKIKDSEGDLHTLSYSDIYVDVFKALGGLKQHIEASDYLSMVCYDKLLKLAQPIFKKTEFEKLIFDTLNAYNKLAGQRYLINLQE